MGKLSDWGRELGFFLMRVFRGLAGLSPEEDQFQGFMDITDIRERSRYPSLHEVYAQEFMRLLKKYGGEEWSIYGDIADEDSHLFIALEGEQRKEGILLQRARTSPQIVYSGQPLTVPEVETKAPEKKKGFLSRLKGEKSTA